MRSSAWVDSYFFGDRIDQAEDRLVVDPIGTCGGEHEPVAFRGMKERRKAPRTDVLQPETIVLGNKEIPYTIRNISAAGACLVVQSTLEIPAGLSW